MKNKESVSPGDFFFYLFIIITIISGVSFVLSKGWSNFGWVLIASIFLAIITNN